MPDDPDDDDGRMIGVVLDQVPELEAELVDVFESRVCAT